MDCPSVQKFGPDHHETLGTIGNLAALRFSNGEVDEAIKLYKR